MIALGEMRTMVMAAWMWNGGGRQETGRRTAAVAMKMVKPMVPDTRRVPMTCGVKGSGSGTSTAQGLSEGEEDMDADAYVDYLVKVIMDMMWSSGVGGAMEEGMTIHRWQKTIPMQLE